MKNTHFLKLTNTLHGLYGTNNILCSNTYTQYYCCKIEQKYIYKKPNN